MRAAPALALLAVLAAGAGAAGAGALPALDSMLPSLSSLLLDNAEQLVRAATAACELLPLQLVAGADEELALDVVEYRRGARAVRRGGVRAAARALRLPAGAPLAVYVPGWGNTARDGAARALAAALLRRHAAVLLLDTAPAFRRAYPAAAARVPAVARALARLLRALAAAGVPPARVHVLGFSLGAHAAAAAGRRAARELGAAPARLTALDPARPCFTRGARALGRGAAGFVQVVHSSAGVLGLRAPRGHADLYVARGAACARRGAGALECDHHAAWRAYAAWAAGGLRARRCAAWPQLRRGACAARAAPLPAPAAMREPGLYLCSADDADAAANLTSSLDDGSFTFANE